MEPALDEASPPKETMDCCALPQKKANMKTPNNVENRWFIVSTFKK